MPIVERYKQDPESVYNTWFIGSDERLKAFRSIRRDVAVVVDDIKQGRFPNDFKGSSLEFVLSCISEQKQVFEGAAHPFYWKPKLRIPDIYENEGNKQAFGEFLYACLGTAEARNIEREILRLAARGSRASGRRSAISCISCTRHCSRRSTRRWSIVSTRSFRPK